jgi:alanine racemase
MLQNAPHDESLAIEASATLTIDPDAIARNWRTAKSLCGASECGGVIKGDGYGTGIAVAANALWDAGCRTFFTATLNEARKARETLPAEATLYVLNGLLPGQAPAFAELNVRPVLGSVVEIEEWCKSIEGQPSPGAALHVDTGMSRLGLTLDEARTLSNERRSLLDALKPNLLMTHMACADIPESPLNTTQRSDFDVLRALFPGVQTSLCNSPSLTWLKAGPDYDLARPGIALFGGEEIEGHDSPFETVVRLDAPVITVRTVPKGDNIGYGGSTIAQRDSRIAVIGVGYADGFHRTASAVAEKPAYRVAIGPHRAPLIGRVNMDLLQIDVTDLPPGAVIRGTGVTVLGGSIPLEETAAAFGTNTYEVMTSLGRRFARRIGPLTGKASA